jgi:hypothetical protein
MGIVDIIISGLVFLFGGIIMFSVGWFISFFFARMMFCFQNRCWRWKT